MDVSRPVLKTLILHFLTSHYLKRALILAKSLTSHPYTRGPLKRRKSVPYKCVEKALFNFGHTCINAPAGPSSSSSMTPGSAVPPASNPFSFLSAPPTQGDVDFLSSFIILFAIFWIQYNKFMLAPPFWNFQGPFQRLLSLHMHWKWLLRKSHVLVGYPKRNCTPIQKRVK